MAPAPRPVAPAGTAPAGPRPSFGPPGGRPARPGGTGAPGGPSRFPRRAGPRTPPTEDEINALAKREHVPARIAKGELEGKMKARIWRKLHAEEAKRFDQAYALMDQHAGLSLADAFGMVQSGMSFEELKSRREKTQKKQAVKDARGAVAGDAVDTFIGAMVTDKTELCVVLGERTFLDTLTAVEPIAFVFERTGRLEKLQVVLLARRTLWEKVSPKLDRDPKLAQKPAPIIRQPERRPVSDPRAFIDRVGKTLTLHLRNGLRISETLLAAGPFDLLVGAQGEELFIPLHAIVRWEDPALVA